MGKQLQQCQAAAAESTVYCTGRFLVTACPHLSHS
jgi:hypothetical protein